MVLPQEGYGTISSTSSANDFDIVPDVAAQGYGTISAAPSGAVYLETLNPGYGLISSMVSSTGNLQMICDVGPDDYYTNKTDYVDLVPDSFAPYIVWGTVAKLLSADSEAKNLRQAQFAQARYEEGLLLVGSLMSEVAFSPGEKP